MRKGSNANSDGYVGRILIATTTAAVVRLLILGCSGQCCFLWGRRATTAPSSTIDDCLTQVSRPCPAAAPLPSSCCLPVSPLAVPAGTLAHTLKWRRVSLRHRAHALASWLVFWRSGNGDMTPSLAMGKTASVSRASKASRRACATAVSSTGSERRCRSGDMREPGLRHMQQRDRLATDETFVGAALA